MVAGVTGPKNFFLVIAVSCQIVWAYIANLENLPFWALPRRCGHSTPKNTPFPEEEDEEDFIHSGCKWLRSVVYGCSFSERLNAAAQHLVHYLEADDAAVAGTTYCQLKQIIRRISDSGLFELLTSDRSLRSSAGKCLDNIDTSKSLVFISHRYQWCWWTWWSK